MIFLAAACQIKARVVTKVLLLPWDKVCLLSQSSLFFVKESKCKCSVQKPPGCFLSPSASLFLFCTLWPVKLSLIFRWSTWAPVDLRLLRDLGVDICRLLLTPADDNLTKHGTDEKAYQSGWGFPSSHIMCTVNSFWRLGCLLCQCHG